MCPETPRTCAVTISKGANTIYHSSITNITMKPSKHQGLLKNQISNSCFEFLHLNNTSLKLSERACNNNPQTMFRTTSNADNDSTTYAGKAPGGNIDDT